MGRDPVARAVPSQPLTADGLVGLNFTLAGGVSSTNHISPLQQSSPGSQDAIHSAEYSSSCPLEIRRDGCHECSQRPKAHLLDVPHRAGRLRTVLPVGRQSETDPCYSQHDVIPEYRGLLEPITHVALAFMPSGMFLEDDRHDWSIFRTVESTREAFLPGTQILVAIGGWGDTSFSIAARNDTSRKAFARNVARMVEATGADGKL